MNVPGGQDWHSETLLTGIGENVPCGHPIQLFPSTGYVPGLHFWHSFDPAYGAYVPGGQGWHSLISATPKNAKVPIGQFAQDLLLTSYVPAPHRLHSLLPA